MLAYQLINVLLNSRFLKMCLVIENLERLWISGHSNSMFAQICQLLDSPSPLIRFLNRKNFKLSMDFSFLAAALNTGPDLKSHLFWKLLGVSVMAETRLVKH